MTRMIYIAFVCVMAGAASAQKPNWWADFPDAIVCLPMTNGAGSVATDASTNANHGLVSSGCVWTTRPGGAGAIWITGGGTNRITIPLAPSMQFGTNITIAFWARYHGSSDRDGWTMGSRQPSYTTGPGWQFYGTYYSGTIYMDAFPLGVGVNGFRRFSTNSLGTGWRHYACTMSDGTNLMMYIDGVAVGANAGTPQSFVASTNVWYIGARPLSDGGTYTSSVSSLVIWDRRDDVARTQHMWVTSASWTGTQAAVSADYRAVRMEAWKIITGGLR